MNLLRHTTWLRVNEGQEIGTIDRRGHGMWTDLRTHAIPASEQRMETRRRQKISHLYQSGIMRSKQSFCILNELKIFARLCLLHVRLGPFIPSMGYFENSFQSYLLSLAIASALIHCPIHPCKNWMKSIAIGFSSQ
jgi:hypothetical protein